ncbi:MAG: N-acetylglucosamine-6-phosphate deacetylase [Actinomycetota bacterium]
MNLGTDGVAANGSLLVHSGTLVDADGARPGWVLIDGGRITAVGDAAAPIPTAAHVIDAAGGYVTPGFVDIHCNGAGGVHFQGGVDHALVAARTMRSFGATRVVASLVTASIDGIVASIEALLPAIERDSGLVGIHVEGPFLAPGRKGAHDPRWLSLPDPGSIDRLLVAAAGTLRKVTLAPELPGALDAIAHLVDAGVAVAVGHTDCDYETAREAFARGASLVTHAFNAMAPIEGRRPGVLGAAIEADHVTIEVIADGLHVHPASIALLFAAAPDRIALVTDAMAATAAPPGRYLLGTVDVDVVEGRAVVAGTETLAGSTLTPDRALRTVVNDCGIGLDQAIAALTVAPARAIGETTRPVLASGARAELVVLDADLSVAAVLAR